MKRGRGYKFFLISVLLLVGVTLVISYFDSQGTMLAPRPPYSQCISNPGLITQSVTICSGTYFDGIEIAGNNVKVKCAGSVFSGTSSTLTRRNGLLINGSWNNIEVEGCTFSNFPENGVLVKGLSGMPNPSNLSMVTLKNVTSSYNWQNGLEIKENTYQIDAMGGSYSNNGLNGVHLISEYKDPARYTVNPDLYPKYFPNDIRIFNATIFNNSENGVHVDAEKYYRQLDDMQRENNTLIFDGNQINYNLANGIKNTDFFSGAYQSGFYFVRGNNILNNGLAGINIHTKKTQGPNGMEINCTLVSGSSFYSGILALSQIDYIYLNKIERNKNGIQLTIDSNSTPNSANSCGGFDPFYEVHTPVVYANRIRYNDQSGVIYQIKDPFPVVGNASDFGTYIRGIYTQNIISFNGNNGVFLNGSASGTDSFNLRHSSATLYCNDFISNINYGVRATGRNNPLLEEKLVYLYLSNFNIVELNTLGGILFNFTGYGGHDFSSYYSYIGSHPLFDIYNGVFSSSPGNMRWNDFVSSPLLAFDIDSLYWLGNYWSDYSPGCVDINPADGWCDVPRPIPAANQDTQPKAGTPWYNNARGYLQLDQGILLSSCSVNIPIYNPRPTTTIVTGSQGGTQLPGMGGGPGGPGGSGTTGSTAGKTENSNFDG